MAGMLLGREGGPHSCALPDRHQQPRLWPLGGESWSFGPWILVFGGVAGAGHTYVGCLKRHQSW